MIYYKEYNRLVWLHDCMLGLVPKPYDCFPYTWTELLNQSYRVLIYLCEDESAVNFANNAKKIAISNILIDNG
jgi:hypothetical protein